MKSSSRVDEMMEQALQYQRSLSASAPTHNMNQLHMSTCNHPTVQTSQHEPICTSLPYHAPSQNTCQKLKPQLLPALCPTTPLKRLGSADPRAPGAAPPHLQPRTRQRYHELSKQPTHAFTCPLQPNSPGAAHVGIRVEVTAVL